MRIMYWGKDGGPESKGWGFWPIELKSLFSIVLLKFENGSREAYHSHAFNAISWLLSGRLVEFPVQGGSYKIYVPSFKPIITKRDTFHKVMSAGTSWAISFRGPWASSWKEYRVREGKNVTLTHGRKIIDTY